ncbi:MAG: porin [Methylobacteriaceae bacterium]|jgi:hypothetical protein|nr:porin [Methylobacteriaceae bacterium]
MTLARSFLLGSAAVFLAASGAAAADLPVKAKNVEYVKVCNTYGVGFFYVPGTDLCLKLGGRIRAEYLFEDDDANDDYEIGFLARGRVDVDARNATEYGTVRAFMRLQLTTSSGAYGSHYTEVLHTDDPLDRAFVQFIGFTAGRTQSFFDFSECVNRGDIRVSDGKVVNFLAYTATIGDG